MEIGILYESKEWSSYALLQNILQQGVSAQLIDTEEDWDLTSLLSYDLIVSRVFASSIFRQHNKSLERMPDIIQFLKEHAIPMINPYEAHFYEISKKRSTLKLGEHGISVPKVYGVFSPIEILCSKTIQYPCIVKPDCGGRTNSTFIVNSVEELAQCMKTAPHISFIAEEYIHPEFGFLTRIEVIKQTCKLILKRSVADNGLSAYHLGSTYSPYPDCPPDIKNTAVKAMELLQIETGSMDIIENKNGFFIIDVNAVSNASEDNTEMFSFDLMKETAQYIVNKHRLLKGSNA